MTNVITCAGSQFGFPRLGCPDIYWLCRRGSELLDVDQFAVPSGVRDPLLPEKSAVPIDAVYLKRVHYQI